VVVTRASSSESFTAYGYDYDGGSIFLPDRCLWEVGASEKITYLPSFLGAVSYNEVMPSVENGMASS